MSTKSEKAAAGLPTNSSHKLEHEAEGAASGAVAGGVLGAVAGPPGAVVGALIGAIAGALTGAALDDDSVAKEADDEKLDQEIGVAGGEMGAPQPQASARDGGGVLGGRGGGRRREHR